MFFLILSSLLVLGALSESPPTLCSTDSNTCEGEFFPIKHGLPSDEIVTRHCDGAIEFAKCLQDYSERCPVPFSMDFGALVDSVVELCNNDSDLRQGYRNHLSCFNEVDFKTSCRDPYERLRTLSFEAHLQLNERRINMECLVLYLIKPCLIQEIEATCGEEGSQAATRFINRGEDILNCSDDDADLFEELLNNGSSESSTENS